jgi:hypothetical protein
MHTVIIYIVCLVFAFKVYTPGNLLAGIDQARRPRHCICCSQTLGKTSRTCERQAAASMLASLTCARPPCLPEQPLGFSAGRWLRKSSDCCMAGCEG